MDYAKKYLNRTGFQRAGLATLPRTKRVKPGYDQEFTLQKGVSAAPIKQSTVLQEILGGGILGIGASKFLEDEDKENLPVENSHNLLISISFLRCTGVATNTFGPKLIFLNKYA